MASYLQLFWDILVKSIDPLGILVYGRGSLDARNQVFDDALHHGHVTRWTRRVPRSKDESYPH